MHMQVIPDSLFARLGSAPILKKLPECFDIAVVCSKGQECIHEPKTRQVVQLQCI